MQKLPWSTESSREQNQLDLLLQPADSTSSSTGSRACGVEEDEPAAAANQQQAASAQCQPVLKAVKLAKCSLNRKKGNTPHAAKGRARDPTCIKEWAALTTWLRMNLHQVGCHNLAALSMLNNVPTPVPASVTVYATGKRTSQADMLPGDHVCQAWQVSICTSVQKYHLCIRLCDYGPCTRQSPCVCAALSPLPTVWWNC